jgi:hypothetical protein
LKLIKDKSLFERNAYEMSFMSNMSNLGNILSMEFPYQNMEIIEVNQNIMEVRKLNIRYNLLIHKRINQDNKGV